MEYARLRRRLGAESSAQDISVPLTTIIDCAIRDFISIGIYKVIIGSVCYFKMIGTLLVLGMLCVNSQGQVYRFDYEFNAYARGWLKYHLVPATWQEARMRCHAEGAVLASPLTSSLKTAMISTVIRRKGKTQTTIFTGVHATFSKGDYTSVEGVPLLRLPIEWVAGEPDNFNNEESCLAMLTDRRGSMSDVRCDEVLSYVCYKKQTNLTMTECGTTDPGYTLDLRTGSCYKFHSRGDAIGLIWRQAFMTCAAEGGHLLIINSELEANVIEELYGSHPDNAGMLIGFHDWGERSTFLTIHGETLDKAGYDVWHENKPDNCTAKRTGDDGEFCGSALTSLKLNDVWCNVPIPFVCEKSPGSLF